MQNEKYITVTQLTRYIKYKLESDENLEKIYLRGEISNFKAHTRGHFYFTLKDEYSRISAIMFSSAASKIKFVPTDGMKVLVECKIGVYEATGNYQVYVSDMMEDGLGNLYLAFKQLQEKLEKEGLFRAEHKKKIPKIPMKVGIITAPTGAAIRDILSTIKRRFPLCETILFPALVQGELAKDDIVKKIRIANTYPLDVIILGRGGGSIEDLWPFNEEIVARAIYDSEIPIISGVGHEIDFTISDFVADLRAPTPTGAAEMAVPSREDLIVYFNQMNKRNTKAILNIIENDRQILKRYQESYILKNPMSLYEKLEQNFDHLYERLIMVINNIITFNNERLSKLKSSFIFKNPQMLFIDKAYNYNDLVKRLKLSINKNIDDNKNRYVNLLSKLEVLNPITTLKRGYSITKVNDKPIRSIKEVKKDSLLNTELCDGTLVSKVIEVRGVNNVNN
ncbi:MAG: exodeoxyribonuclease VII large subunit [Bacilli bacterium]|nr:exodeoxyribonuclease VII large subunit [Bacilli bacterium]